MSQKRFWNWEDDDSTFDLSRQNVGLLESGRYRGFESSLPSSNMSELNKTEVLEAGPMGMGLVLSHNITGAIRTLIDRNISVPFGIVVTKQGVIIQEDAPITLPIEPTGSVPRTDLIVCEHEYKEITGGLEAKYLVIKGSSILPPEVPKLGLQVVIGTLALPANCTDLSKGATYDSSASPAFAGQDVFIRRKDGYLEGVLDAKNNRIKNLAQPTSSGDATNKRYVDDKFDTIKAASEVARGLIEIATQAETDDGQDDLRAVTPKKLATNLRIKTATQGEVSEGSNSSKFVTPATLHNKIATESQRGLARLATTKEIADGKDDSTIVTPYKLKEAYRDQYLVELGEWNIGTMRTKTIPHRFPWWQRIVGIGGAVYNDVGDVINFETLQITVKVTSNSFIVTASKDVGTATANSNRGYLLLHVSDEVKVPDSRIIVNAGQNVTIERMFVETKMLVLTKVIVNREDITFSAQLPEGYDYSQLIFQYKRENSDTWINELGQVPEFPWGALNGLEGDGETYVFRLSAKLVGGDFEYSNELKLVNTGWNEAVYDGVYGTHKVAVKLKGFVELIGSSLSNTIWELRNKPSGSNPVITQPYQLDTDIKLDSFGEYAFRLTATNAKGERGFDEVIISFNKIVNQRPTAVARFSDGTTNKQVAWKLYDPITGKYNGNYLIVLDSRGSSDVDGVLLDKVWEKSFNNEPWQKVTNSGGVIAAQKDGNYQFRLKVQDNYGAWSDWSNTIVLNITGTEDNGVPLSTFRFGRLSGGEGSFNFQGTLYIAPQDRVSKLIIGLADFKVSGNPTEPNGYSDIGVNLRGHNNGNVKAWSFTFKANDRSFVIDDYNKLGIIEGSGLVLNCDLANIPPKKRAVVNIVALDSAGLVIGKTEFVVGSN